MEVRYRAYSYATCQPKSLSDLDKEEWEVSISIERFSVLRKTDKGAWISAFGRERFVLNGPGKRFAHETIEWAVHSLRRRTRFYAAHLARRLDITEAVNAYFAAKSDEEILKEL